MGKGFLVGGGLVLAVTIVVAVLADSGFNVDPLEEVLFAPVGMIALAMKGDNWTGTEPLVVRMFPLVAGVAVNVGIGGVVGAVWALLWRRAG